MDAVSSGDRAGQTPSAASAQRRVEYVTSFGDRIHNMGKNMGYKTYIGMDHTDPMSQHQDNYGQTPSYNILVNHFLSGRPWNHGTLK